jgi:hypothetical protein
LRRRRSNHSVDATGGAVGTARILRKSLKSDPGQVNWPIHVDSFRLVPRR